MKKEDLPKYLAKIENEQQRDELFEIIKKNYGINYFNDGFMNVSKTYNLFGVNVSTDNCFVASGGLISGQTILSFEEYKKMITKIPIYLSKEEIFLIKEVFGKTSPREILKIIRNNSKLANYLENDLDFFKNLYNNFCRSCKENNISDDLFTPKSQSFSFSNGLKAIYDGVNIKIGCQTIKKEEFCAKYGPIFDVVDSATIQGYVFTSDEYKEIAKQFGLNT